MELLPIFSQEKALLKSKETKFFILCVEDTCVMDIEGYSIHSDFTWKYHEDKNTKNVFLELYTYIIMYC